MRGWGARVVVGGMHGCGSACMVVGGHAWLQGTCMVVGGCMCGCSGGCVVVGEHAWLWGGVYRIRRDTVNERAVRILLECILVWLNFDPVDFPFGISIFISVFRPYKIQQCITKHLDRKLKVHILHILILITVRFAER